MTDKLPTSLELLESQLSDVREVVDRLLESAQLSYYDPNVGGGVIFLGWNPHRWGELKDGGQRDVGKARKSWQALHDLVAQAVRRSAPERLSRLEEPDRLLRCIIEQDNTHGAPGSSIEVIRRGVAKALDGIAELLHELPAAHGDGGWLLVPDTNALLYKPELASWQPPAGSWTVVLVPQVLRELDGLKMRRDLGPKAEGVIRRIKEYARRGDSFVGVPIAGTLRLREVAIDPDMSDTLPWLQAGHADDQMLASVLELRCENLNAVVALATRDRNLQNKARLARCPYLDVEDEL
jgi:PIN domain